MLPTSCIHPLVTRTIVISSLCNQTHVCWGLKHTGEHHLFATQVSRYELAWWQKSNKTSWEKTFMQYRILPCSVSRTGFGITAQGALARSRGKATGKLSGFPPRALAAVRNCFLPANQRSLPFQICMTVWLSFLFWSLSISHVFARIWTCNRTSAIAQVPSVFKEILMTSCVQTFLSRCWEVDLQFKINVSKTWSVFQVRNRCQQTLMGQPIPPWITARLAHLFLAWVTPNVY